MRLIDADKLPFNTVGICDAQENFYGCAEVTFAEDIETAPTVDAEIVVRCKDCIYWQDNNAGYPHDECRWGHEETPDPDDFCSYGVRK